MKTNKSNNKEIELHQKKKRACVVATHVSFNAIVMKVRSLPSSYQVYIELVQNLPSPFWPDVLYECPLSTGLRGVVPLFIEV